MRTLTQRNRAKWSWLRGKPPLPGSSLGTALVLCAALGAQGRVQGSVQPTVQLTFGVYTSDRATEMYKTFAPILEHLQGTTTKRLERSVRIRLKIFKSYAAALKALVEGKVDFVRFGPASYVLAKQQQPAVSLLAMEHKNGKKLFKGLIVVRWESPIEKLSDLQQHTFAFGDKNSTIGRFLAQQELHRAGVDARDLKGYAYLGRHDKVLRAVEFGDYDAGSVKSSTFYKLNKDGRAKLRILRSFDNVTKPWIARAGLDADIAAALRQALLAYDDQTSLKRLKVSGFATAMDRDYEPIRKAMAAARKFAPPVRRHKTSPQSRTESRK